MRKRHSHLWEIVQFVITVISVIVTIIGIVVTIVF